MNVLVTDGESRAALAVTRSLGKKGCRVFVAGERANTLAAASRFCTRDFTIPSVSVNQAGYAKAVAGIARDHGIEAVLPITDVSNQVLASRREEFPPGTRLLAPPSEVLERVSDKSHVFRVARSLGLSIPETVFVDGPNALQEIEASLLPFPVVVKPFRSRIITTDGVLSTSVHYARSKNELEDLYRRRPYLRWPSMIQERIIGPGTGLFTLFDGERHLALFCHRRIREKPPSGGVSVLCESVPVDRQMADEAATLLRELKWRGVAMVEYKRDVADGRAKLMEINGRFWGSLQLAIDCGIDFPSLYLDFAFGRAVNAPTEYPVGRRLRWFFGDLDQLLIRLRDQEGVGQVAKAGISRWRALKEFLTGAPLRTKWDVFRLNDPRPLLFETGDYARELFRDVRRAMERPR